MSPMSLSGISSKSRRFATIVGIRPFSAGSGTMVSKYPLLRTVLIKRSFSLLGVTLSKLVSPSPLAIEQHLAISTLLTLGWRSPLDIRSHDGVSTTRNIVGLLLSPSASLRISPSKRSWDTGGQMYCSQLARFCPSPGISSIKAARRRLPARLMASLRCPTSVKTSNVDGATSRMAIEREFFMCSSASFSAST